MENLTTIIAKIAIILNVAANGILSAIMNIKGAKFIALHNYVSATSGEIANYIINVNVSVENAKKADLSTLQGVNDATLMHIAKAKEITFEVVKTAYNELLASAIKNLNADPTERSNQSQGQTNAYLNLTPSVRFHLESKTFHVFGQEISKVVIEKGSYKSVNSSDKTLAKKAITKYLNLRAGKFRTFIVDNIDNIQVSGEVVTA